MSSSSPSCLSSGLKRIDILAADNSAACLCNESASIALGGNSLDLRKEDFQGSQEVFGSCSEAQDSLPSARKRLCM